VRIQTRVIMEIRIAVRVRIRAQVRMQVQWVSSIYLVKINK
jgi:hypothetical protein